MAFFRRLAAQWAEKYRKMNIQMVISLSFTIVATVGILIMGLSLFWRFPPPTANRWPRTASVSWPRPT